MSGRRFSIGAPDLGPWRAGNTGVPGVWRFESGVPGREVLVSALVHGNELCGAWALCSALQAGLRPRAGAWTLMFANLDAFDRFDAMRPDASRYVDHDMNRLWGDMAWRHDLSAHGSEHLRVLALAPFVERSEWLLDLHSMHEEGEPLGLAGPLAHHARQALALGAPGLVVADAGHRAGRRMRDHGPYGDPDRASHFALLVECGFHGAPSSVTVAHDMLRRFLLASSTLVAPDLPGGWPSAAWPEPPRSLRVTHAVTVAEGPPPQLARAWRSGERVPQAGTVIGRTGDQPVVTPYDDCVLIMPTLVHASAGATLVRFAQEVDVVPCG
jgi:hypothetical protein